MKRLFTADWHVGELPAANTHSLLRVKPNEVLVEEWINLVNSKLTEEDELWFIGDLAINLDDLDFIKRINAKLIVILGDKELENKNFSYNEFLQKKAEITNEKDFIYFLRKEIEINGITFQVMHKPVDCLKTDMPSICGHVHGIWRTQKSNTGQPLLNVGIDAWGQLVTEELIMHQYNAVIKGYYDSNCFINL